MSATHTTPKLTYALDSKESLIHISQVERGLACNCLCPKCREQLMARKGKKNEHHFAHVSGKYCPGSVESSLHYLAKKLFETGCKLKLPELTLDKEFLSKYPTISSAIVEDSRIFTPEKVYIEKPLNDIVPDLILESSGEKIIVEIYVSHKVDADKLLKIQEKGIPAIEINLKNISREITEDSLREILESGDYNSWIFNKKLLEAKERIIKEQAVGISMNIAFREARGKLISTNFTKCHIDKNGKIINPPCNNILATNEETEVDKSVCERCCFIYNINGKKICLDGKASMQCRLKPGKGKDYPCDVIATIMKDLLKRDISIEQVKGMILN